MKSVDILTTVVIALQGVGMLCLGKWLGRLEERKRIFDLIEEEQNKGNLVLMVTGSCVEPPHTHYIPGEEIGMKQIH